MGKREIAYQIVICFLLLTIAGILYFPKPAPEPIIYTAAGEIYTEDVEDESQPVITSAAKNTSGSTSNTKPNPTARPKSTPTPGKITAAEGTININTATESQLIRLPGIGNVTAQKIIEYRSSHGGFATISDIKKVSGIGTAKFEAIKDLISVD